MIRTEVHFTLHGSHRRIQYVSMCGTAIDRTFFVCAGYTAGSSAEHRAAFVKVGYTILGT